MEKELTLYIRALLARTKLGMLAASVLAEEGRGSTAMKMLHDGQLELRSEFFDLYNRLKPLATIEPETSLRERVPGLRNRTLEAFDTVKAIAAQLHERVLPSIPNPHEAHEVTAKLSPATVAQLAALAA